MKLNYLCLCIAISIIACSCTKDEPINSSIRRAPHHETTKIDEELMTKDFDYAKSVLYDFVDQHGDVYGEHLMIFEDLESLEKEIHRINSMDYNTLRSWQLQHGLTSNDVINSIIIHDSIQSNVFKRYEISSFFKESVDAQDEDIYKWSEEQEAKEDIAFNEYDEIMRSKYSQYTKERKEDDGSVVYEPLGVLDEQVFYNKNGIYICDGILYKKLEDGILSCLYYNYSYFVECKTSEDVAKSPHNALAHATTNSSQSENIGLGIDYTFYDSNYYNKPKHRLSVNFHISVTGAWFGLEARRVTMCARNEHKCSGGGYRTVACETKITAPVTTSCPFTGDWDVKYNTGWCPMKQGMIYYRLKYFNCGCKNTHFKSIEIDAKNQHGIKIVDKKP